MKTPLISVITTVYNCSSYIKSSICSILNQNFKDFEFIIINDGSTDDTSYQIQKIIDPRVIYIDTKENKGVSNRRNYAISLSKGEYICIQDGDDISLPDRLSKQIDFIDKNKDIFCIGGFAEKIDESEKNIGIMDYSPRENKEIIECIIKKRWNPIIDPTTIFRKDIFLKLGNYSENINVKYIQDFDLWLKAIMNGYLFYNFQEPLIKYRFHSKSVTNTYKKEAIKQHINILNKFLREYK